VEFGRKPKLIPYQREEAIARREGGEAQSAITRTYSVETSNLNCMKLDKLVARPPLVTLPLCEVAFSPQRHRCTRRVAQTHRRTSYRP
jgi:hypothetical protein